MHPSPAVYPSHATDLGRPSAAAPRRPAGGSWARRAARAPTPSLLPPPLLALSTIIYPSIRPSIYLYPPIYLSRSRSLSLTHPLALALALALTPASLNHRPAPPPPCRGGGGRPRPRPPNPSPPCGRGPVAGSWRMAARGGGSCGSGRWCGRGASTMQLESRGECLGAGWSCWCAVLDGLGRSSCAERKRACRIDFPALCID